MSFYGQYIAMNKPHDPYYGAYKLKRDTEPRLWIAPRIYSDDINEYVRALYHIISRKRNFRDYNMHPAVSDMLQEYGRPLDWHKLVLESPQVATDGIRLAYARNETKLEAHWFDSTDNKHLTATTIAKYLTRHWPNVPSDKIRNVAARHTVDVKLLDTIEEMVKAVQECEAASCMQWGEGYLTNVGAHPYEVYAPELGWKLAVAMRGDAVVGRALVLDTPEHKCFVRTYGNAGSDGYTQSHDGIAGWLESKGFMHAKCWPEGAKFAKIRRNDTGDWIAPYLDPGSATIEDDAHRAVSSHGNFWVRDNGGEYLWDCPDGSMSEKNSATCDRCGDPCNEDDTTSTGYHGDHCVCSDCLDAHYTSAIGRRGRTYYTDSGTLEGPDGDNYVTEYLSDNGMVHHADGERCIMADDAILVDDEYYSEDDVAGIPDDCGDIVYDSHNCEYIMRSDAHWCKHNMYWISDSESTAVDKGHVHEDSFDEYLASLPRDSVQLNCDESELEEKLAMWDAENQIEVPVVEPAVT